MYRPRLRTQLHVSEEGVLVDPLPDRDVQLSAVGQALCRSLDGHHELGEIVGGLVAAGHPRGDVETAFRWLLLVHAIEGAGDATSASVDRIARGQTRLPLVILDGARFECQGSGACCRNYVLGPIYDDDVERLETLGLGEAFPDLTAPYFLIDDGGDRRLATIAERCIFLDADERCRLHLRFGGEAKPRICRLYPLEVQATVAGLRLGDKGSCSRFATSARAGRPLDDDVQRLAPLLAGMEHELHHPIVTIDGVPCDYGIALAFGKAAIALARQDHGTAATTLAAIGDGLSRLRTGLSSCPLEPGEPDRSVAAVLATAPAWAAPPADDRTDVIELLEDLAAIRPLGAEARALLDDSARALREQDGAPAVRIDDLDIDAVLRLSMRQQLFGQRAVLEHRVAAGLVRIALIQTLAVWGARRAAAEDGRHAVRAEDLSRSHAVAIRTLESAAAEHLVAQREATWRTILPALPAILGLGYRRPMP